MEYGDVAAHERLTGRAFFLPTGATGAIDLGNIQMMSLDFGVKQKEHMKARRGIVFTDRVDGVSMSPRWEITGDEYLSANLPLIFMGTGLGRVTTPAVTSATFTFTAYKEKWQSIYRVALTNATLTSPPGKVEGFQADYVIDRGAGFVYIPFTSTIADGTAGCVVRYDAPSVVMDWILPALSTLTRTGVMQLFEEDDISLIPKTVHTFGVTLSTASDAQTKVDEFKSFKMIAAITNLNTWSVQKRSLSYASSTGS